jgi:hypothetical protein
LIDSQGVIRDAVDRPTGVSEGALEFTHADLALDA